MNNLINDLRAAQNLVARRACHVATELDLHCDTIDARIMADELADLQQASLMLETAKMPVPDVIPHLLARAGKSWDSPTD